MALKALCVGINDYPIANADLRGCVNDAKAWANTLNRHYGFARRDIATLFDADATKAAMVSGIKTLLAGAQPGDVLVFTNSSHGTYVADSGAHDEGDHYDEAICPYDSRKHLLVDDEMRELLADIPKRVRLTVISDSCHSGSVTRLAPGLTPDQRVARFINPKTLRRPVIADIRNATPTARDLPESQMTSLLVSGCRSDEYSYDAKFGRKFHGAMTYFALRALAEANYQITYTQLMIRLRQLLDDARFDQHPQLEGPTSFKRRQVFS